MNFALKRLSGALCCSSKSGICGHSGIPHLAPSAVRARQQWELVGSSLNHAQCACASKQLQHVFNKYCHGDGCAGWPYNCGLSKLLLVFCLLFAITGETSLLFCIFDFDLQVVAVLPFQQQMSSQSLAKNGVAAMGA